MAEFIRTHKKTRSQMLIGVGLLFLASIIYTHRCLQVLAI